MNTFIKITNEDVYKKVEDQHETLREILAQTKKTNGRVTILEKKSLGMMIARNPYKFTIFVLVFFSFVISDSRHAILNMLIKFFI